MFNRKKHREADSMSDIQRLKQEIRNELARIHGGVPYEESVAPQGEAAPQAPVSDQAEAQPELAPAAPVRVQAVSSSPLIQRAALSQIAAGLPRANGAVMHDDESPLGAFRHLVERFEAAAGRIEAAVDRVERLGARASTEPAPARIQEPRFGEGGAAIRIVLAGVPNFQALMDFQRAFTALARSGEATVQEFDHDQAALDVSLGAPMGLSEIMEALRESCAHALLVEESRPEAARLRLRFIPQQPRRSEILNPERWAKA